jgi:transposase
MGSGSSTAATPSATTPSGEWVRQKKSAANTLAALKSIRAARPDGAPAYIILDNLSTHHGNKIRAWAARNKAELCFTPT